jgi:hypothetical protein
MLRTLAISSFLFVGAASIANADVYRWVDDHGGVHYSDQSVPGSQLIKSTKPRPSEGGSSRRASGSPRPTPIPVPTSVNSGEHSAADAMKQDKAKIREQQCKDAKERYNKAIEARRIYKGSRGGDKSKDGDDAPREYLSDEEADAYRVKAREEMQDLCGEAPK